MTLLFIYGVFALWSWVNGAFNDEAWTGKHNSTSNFTNSTIGGHGRLGNVSLPLTNTTDSSNGTQLEHPPCNDTNWSPGSAFFTIIALTFGYFAHPRGSSAFRDSGRTWRLSPVFAFYETWCLLLRIFSALPIWGYGSEGYTVREIAYALLAMRVGNAWSQEEYEKFVEKWVHEEEKKLEAGQQQQHPPSLRPAQTWPRLAQEIQDIYTASPKQNQAFPEMPSEGAKLEKWRRKLRIEIFQQHLRIVDTFEHGPSIRVFIWIPMLFQLAKLFVVSGAWFAKTIGFIYFFSWLLIEILSIFTAERPISGEEAIQATNLAVNIYEAPNWRAKGEKNYPIVSTQAGIWGNVLLFIHGALNFFSLGRVLGYHGFTELLLSFIIFIPFISPFPLILISAIIGWLWRLVGLEKRFGKLWYSAVIPNVKDADYFAVYPAFLALFSLVLEVLMFAGVGAAKGSFPCWATRKPGWYDWLG